MSGIRTLEKSKMFFESWRVWNGDSFDRSQLSICGEATEVEGVKKCPSHLSKACVRKVHCKKTRHRRKINIVSVKYLCEI